MSSRRRIWAIIADTSAGNFIMNTGGTVSQLGSMIAGSITLNGRLNPTGSLTASNIDGTGSLTLTDLATTVNTVRIRVNGVSASGTLTISPSGTDNAVSRLASPPTFTGGLMDLTDNDLVVDYPSTSPLGVIQAEITAAYAGSAWTGGQLTSSFANSTQFALGFAETSAVFTTFPAMFSGQSVDSTTVLVRYTLYGDADLSGTVDTIDFGLLVANFSMTGESWVNGDFDCETTVTSVDFSFLAANFSKIQPAPEDSALVLVPEPGAIASLIFLGLLARHRRSALT